MLCCIGYESIILGSLLESFQRAPSFIQLKWNRKSPQYDCACSHPEYQLVELKSGHQCVRPFLGFYTFEEAQMICNFDRSSILAPNDLEDAETFLDLASNGNDIWLPFKYFDVINDEMGYWKNYKSDQMATFLHFAPRNPDLGRGNLLQINKV